MIEKLDKAQNFVQWRLRVKYVLCREDIALKSLQNKPNIGTDYHAE